MTRGVNVTYRERIARGWRGMDPARRRRARSPYATCPECGREAAVVHGRLQFHAPRLGIGWVECPGTSTQVVLTTHNSRRTA